MRHWWVTHLPDSGGGFYGEIDNDGQPVIDAPQSAILTARMLWVFSVLNDPLAGRAYAVLRRFLTPDCGHLYWLMDRDGIVEDRRLAMAQAYAILAFTEYGDIDLARQLMASAEADVLANRSEGDTRSVVLHLMEAYTYLHARAPDVASETALRRALTTFLSEGVRDGHVVGPPSPGHDSEASWLVWHAAQVLGTFENEAREMCLLLAQQTLTAPIDEWWGHAEALIAFANAWQITGKVVWRDALEQRWTTLKTEFNAGKDGDWSWYAASSAKTGPYKAGLWKCPFHIVRALLEVERRLTPSAPGGERN